MYSYSLPFDRHDWIVDRDGKEVRYVIDFYKGADKSQTAGAPISIFLDIRPALDSFSALYDRVTVSIKEKLGIDSIKEVNQSKSIKKN